MKYGLDVLWTYQLAYCWEKCCILGNTMGKESLETSKGGYKSGWVGICTPPRLYLKSRRAEPTIYALLCKRWDKTVVEIGWKYNGISADGKDMSYLNVEQRKLK